MRAEGAMLAWDHNADIVAREPFSEAPIGALHPTGECSKRGRRHSLTGVNRLRATAHSLVAGSKPERMMKVERVYTRRVMATTRSTTLAEAAATMSRFQVGSLLVMDDNRSGMPVGIVTDRDIALQGFASESMTVGSAMTPVLATVHESADVHEALETMRSHGVRRLIVTGHKGEVLGILSVDDVVDGLSADLAAAAAVLRGELRRDSAGLGEVKIGG